MSHEPAATPSTTRAARRTWRPARRRTLAYVAGVGAVATALVVQACADGGLTGTTATPPPKAAVSEPGTLETSRAPSAKAAPLDVAWVGEVHNRGLDAVLAKARRASAADRATPKARCALIGRLTAQFLTAERTRNPHLRTLGPAKLTSTELATLARDAACSAEAATRLPLGEAALSLRGSGGLDRRLELEGDGNLSPAAVVLLNEIDDTIRWMSGAQQLSDNLIPVQQRAELLSDNSERILILETITTARASAFYQQSCTDPAACAGDRPPDATRASERRAGVNSDVVKADAWGCVWGGLRGVVGGPSGVFAGCLWGGLGSSGGIIFRHLTT